MSSLPLLQDNIDPAYCFGEIIYPIGFIHPTWDILIQKYDYYYEHEGVGSAFLSSFELFLNGSPVPRNFSYYNRRCKDSLWEVIFNVKRYYFEKYKPAMVYHHVKNDIPFSTRFALYKEKLDSPFYNLYDMKPHTILAIRNDLAFSTVIKEVY